MILRTLLSAVATAGEVLSSETSLHFFINNPFMTALNLFWRFAFLPTLFRSVMLPSKRTQKRKGIDLLSFCPQPPKLTTRAIMEAHAPAIDDGA
jgi:hypothetical protein